MRDTETVLKDLTARGRIYKILLLDDDGELKVLLEDYLNSRFFLVTSADNGMQALPHVLENDFDVIISDMQMPALSGEMFYRAVERSKPGLCPRFIFITGKASDPDIAAFLTQVQARFLQKPFQFSELVHSISDVIENTEKKLKR